MSYDSIGESSNCQSNPMVPIPSESCEKNIEPQIISNMDSSIENGAEESIEASKDQQ